MATTRMLGDGDYGDNGDDKQNDDDDDGDNGDNGDNDIYEDDVDDDACW